MHNQGFGSLNNFQLWFNKLSYKPLCYSLWRFITKECCYLFQFPSFCLKSEIFVFATTAPSFKYKFTQESLRNDQNTRSSNALEQNVRQLRWRFFSAEVVCNATWWTNSFMSPASLFRVRSKHTSLFVGTISNNWRSTSSQMPSLTRCSTVDKVNTQDMQTMLTIGKLTVEL